mgnify:CR=1 FL=1
MKRLICVLLLFLIGCSDPNPACPLAGIGQGQECTVHQQLENWCSQGLSKSYSGIAFKCKCVNRELRCVEDLLDKEELWRQ